VAAQPSGDVRQDDVAVVELDGKRRARKDLLDAAERLERRFFDALGILGFWGRGIGLTVSIANSYGRAPLQYECSPSQAEVAAGVRK
jgi:hypothetical protein